MTDTKLDGSLRERAVPIATNIMKLLSSVTAEDAAQLLASLEKVLDLGVVSIRWLGLIAITRNPSRQDAIVAVRRLASRLFRTGNYSALCGLMFVLFREDVVIPVEWVETVLREIIAGNVNASAYELFLKWIERGGTISPAICEIVRDHHERLLRSHSVGLDWYIEVQSEQPTTTGWLRLVEVGPKCQSLPIAASAFGNKLALARETLQEAIETWDDPEREVFQRWFAELEKSNG
jgi:hypothetical protein